MSDKAARGEAFDDSNGFTVPGCQLSQTPHVAAIQRYISSAEMLVPCMASLQLKVKNGFWVLGRGVHGGALFGARRAT